MADERQPQEGQIVTLQQARGPFAGMTQYARRGCGATPSDCGWSFDAKCSMPHRRNQKGSFIIQVVGLDGQASTTTKPNTIWCEHDQPPIPIQR